MRRVKARAEDRYKKLEEEKHWNDEALQGPVSVPTTVATFTCKLQITNTPCTDISIEENCTIPL